MYFEKPGEQNTTETLRLACKRAQELGIDELVIATSTGATAYAALEICDGMKIVAVSYHAGFREPFKLVMPEKVMTDLRAKGVAVVCATHALSGVERGIAKKFPGNYPVLLVAEVLRMFGQGTKVAVEVAIMAADAGELSGNRIVSVGGSGRGGDTALVLTPACQNAFFDMKIHEVICKPALYE